MIKKISFYILAFIILSSPIHAFPNMWKESHEVIEITNGPKTAITKYEDRIVLKPVTHQGVTSMNGYCTVTGKYITIVTGENELVCRINTTCNDIEYSVLTEQKYDDTSKEYTYFYFGSQNPKEWVGRICCIYDQQWIAIFQTF